MSHAGSCSAMAYGVTHLGVWQPLNGLKPDISNCLSNSIWTGPPSCEADYLSPKGLPEESSNFPAYARII